jgi:hypothetical protein
MRTPKWWFKGRPKVEKKPDAAAPSVTGKDPTANVTAATLTSTRSRISPGATPAVANDPTANVTASTLLSGRSRVASGAAPTPQSVVAAPEQEEALDEPSVVVRDYSEPEPILAEQFFEPEVEPEPAPVVRPVPVSAKGPAPAPVPLVERIVKSWSSVSRRREGTPFRGPVHFEVDQDRQEITLRMRYTTAIVGSFGVLVAIASAYVIGRHLGETSSGASTAMLISSLSSQQIKDGPAQPGVLDIGRDRARVASAKIDGSAPPVVKKKDPDVFEDAQINTAGIAFRSAGRNYVIVAIFPPAETDTAIRACDFLCAHGIVCTLERDVHGEPPHWLSVVGVRGFPHKFKESRDYIAYHDAIIALNDKFPAKSNFGRFDPMPYKWDGN